MPFYFPSTGVAGPTGPAGTPGADGNVINVKSTPYSAAGNGATDDSAALQAAFDAGASGNIPVFLPKGTYRHVTKLNLASNLTLYGAGMGVSVLKYDPASLQRGNIEQVDITVALNNVTLRDFTVDRTATHAAHGIYLTHLDNFRMERVAVVGPPGEWATSGTPSVAVCIGSFGSLATQDNTNIAIHGCHFTRTSDGGVQLGRATGVSIVGNTFDNVYREVIACEPYTTGVVKDVVISGNTIRMGIKESVGSDGAILCTTSSQTTPTNETQLTGISIVGNTITAGTLTASDPASGINCVGGFNIAIVGNTVEGMGGEGIVVGGPSTNPAKRVTVVGNVVRNCASQVSRAGIYARYASGCVFSGNVVTGTTHSYAIQEDATCADNSWHGGYVEAGTSGAYTFAPTSARTGIRVASTYPENVLGRRSVVSPLALTAGITFVASTIHDVCSLAAQTGALGDYGGLLDVEVRATDADGGVNTARYLLFVAKSALGNHTTLVASNGLSSGAAASWPSFTFSVNDTTNKLRATPIGSTAGTFYFYVTALGNLTVAP